MKYRGKLCSLTNLLQIYIFIDYTKTANAYLIAFYRENINYPLAVLLFFNLRIEPVLLAIQSE